MIAGGYECGSVDRHRLLVGEAMLEVSTSWFADRTGRHAVTVAARLAHNGLGRHEALIECCDRDGAVLLRGPLTLQRSSFDQPWWAESRWSSPVESAVASVRCSVHDVVGGAASPVRVSTPAGPVTLTALAGLQSVA